MPTSSQKLWNTQYMDSYNKRRVAPHRTKGIPTVPGRYNNPHPKKNFLDPPSRPRSAFIPSYFLSQEEEDAFEEFYRDLALQNGGIYAPGNFTLQNGNINTTSQNIPDQILSVCGTKAPISNRPEKKTASPSQTPAQKETNGSPEEAKHEEAKADLPQRVPTPPKDERPKTPAAQELHWSCWPEPAELDSPPPRPHTVLGIHRAATPYGAGGDDIEDRPNSTEPSYVFGANEESTRGPPLTFVPELQSWVNATTDYDREVAQQIMAMNGSLAPPLPPQALRPQRQATFTFGSTKNRTSSFQQSLDPRNHYTMSWRPFNDPANRVMAEEKIVREMDKKMHLSESLPQIPRLQRSNTEIRPMQRRVIRYPRGEEYVHEHSMFMTTQPLVRGHFIIHPDWVSERMTKKRINLAIPAIRNEFRYGTTYSSEY